MAAVLDVNDDTALQDSFCWLNGRKVKIPNESLIVDEATGLRVFRATSSPEIYGTKAVYLAFGTRRPAHQETTEFFTFRVMTREVTDSDFLPSEGTANINVLFNASKVVETETKIPPNTVWKQKRPHRKMNETSAEHSNVLKYLIFSIMFCHTQPCFKTHRLPNYPRYVVLPLLIGCKRLLTPHWSLVKSL